MASFTASVLEVFYIMTSLQLFPAAVLGGLAAAGGVARVGAAPSYATEPISFPMDPVKHAP